MTGVAIETPLGVLMLDAVFSGVTVELGELSPVPSSPLRRAEWVSPWARVSFWLGAIDSNLLLDPAFLPRQSVEQCYGVLWRVEARRDMTEEERLLFRCRWVDPSSHILAHTGRWETGATVDVWRWRDGRIDLCVGTSSEIDLAYMGRQRSFALPERWYDPSQPNEPALLGVEPTRMSERGLEVSFPALRAGEVCHANFSVAWKTLRLRENGQLDEDDIDTWMSVDLASARIVQAVARHLPGD